MQLRQKMSLLVFFNKITNFLSTIVKIIFNSRQTEQQSVAETPEIANNYVLEIKYTRQLQYDFEYQQAALAYYGNQWAKAERFFALIAGNPDHPWSAQAAFSLARLYISEYQALLVNESDSRELAIILSKAEQQFKNIIVNPKRSEFHQAANGMLDYILGQRDPFALFKKAENTLTASADPVALKQALKDYLYLWRDFNATVESSEGFEKRIITEGNDLSQWILVWQHYQPEYLDLIKNKYRESGSEPWLLALARFLPTSDPDYKNIEQKVSQLPASSVAYWTANHYVIKKTIDDGNIEKAKSLINNLSDKNVSVVEKDYLEDLKMRTADSVIELFKHAERRAYEISGSWGFTTEAEDKIIASIPFLDNKAKVIFESKLTLSKQIGLVLRDDIFSAKQAMFLRLVTMVRAFLLKDYVGARRIAIVLAQSNSELKKDLSGFITASANEEKEFNAVVFMLRYPGVGAGIYDEALIDKSMNSSMSNIDLNPRSNYKEIFNYNVQRWDYCHPIHYVWSSEENGGGYKEIFMDTQHDDYDLGFIEKIISKNDQEFAAQQLKNIFNNAPANYFAKVVLGYAKQHPNSAIIPEALHMVVKATRFAGCSDDDTSSFSKKAFQLLHYKYPKNYWTKQTPYYF